MKATFNKAIVRTVEEIVEPEKITLELSVLEAKVLGAMFGGLDVYSIEAMIQKHQKIHFNVCVEEVPKNFNHEIYNTLIRATSQSK